MSSDHYDVGYKKPPKATRFKKGESGNPKGRPKGSPNMLTAIERAVQETVVINVNGKRKTISKLDASAIQLANKAAQGDQRAMAQLLAIAPVLDERSAATATPPMDEADQQVANLIIEKIRKAKDTTKPGGK